MGVQAVFSADFSDFTAAVKKAQFDLRSFDAEAGKAEKALRGVTDSFSGRKIIQDATLATEAVERMGGVSKLTESEFRRLQATVTEATAKMRALGIDVPPGMQKIADATKDVGTAARGTTSLLSGMAAQLAGMFTIGAVVAFGRSVLAAGDQIQKMADQTGLSTEQVQRLQYVAGQSGTSIDSLVGAVQNLQQRLGDDSTGAAGAMKRLGINTEAFNRLGTYQQMTSLAESVRAIQDPTEQASVAAALFGKTWKEILPAIKSGMEDVGNQAPIMADSTVKSLDRVGDALTRSRQQAITWGSGVVLAIEGAGFAFGDFLSQFNPANLGLANSQLLKMQERLADPDGVRGALVMLPPLAKKAAEGFKGLGMSAAELDRVQEDLDRQLEKSIVARKTATTATKTLAQTQKEWTATVGKANQDLTFMWGRLRAVVPAIESMDVSFGEALIPIRAFTTDLEFARAAINAIPPAISSMAASAGTSLKDFGEVGESWGGALSRLAGVSGDGSIGVQFADNFKQAAVQGLADLPALLEHAFDGTAVGDQLGKDIGAAIGAVLGGFFGPLGSAAGAQAGSAFAEGFRSDGEDVVRRVGRDWGFFLSEEMGNAIAADAHNLFPIASPQGGLFDLFSADPNGSEGNLLAAEVFNLGNLIREFGVNADNAATLTGKLRDTFTFLTDEMYKNGRSTFSAVQATKVLDESFGALAAHATQNGALVSKELLEIIRLTEQAGLSSRAVNDFVTGQLGGAVGGLTAIVGPAAAAMKTLGEQQKELDALNAQASKLSVGGSAEENQKLAKEIQAVTAAMEKQQQIIGATAITSPTAAAGLTGALFGSFSELTARGMSAADAIKTMTPAIDGLQVQLLAAGLNGGAAFQQIQAMATLAADEVGGPALAAIHGAAEALSGLHNAGILNQEMFGGLSEQATSTFDTLVAQGKDSAAAMALIAPDLQKIWGLQKDFGYVVDDSTQKLLDQAIDAGLVGDAHKSAQDKAVTAMEKAALAMEKVGETLERVFGTAGTESEEFARRTNDAIATIPRDIEVHVRGTYIPPSGIGGGIDNGGPMAAGGSGTVTRPTLFLAGEAGAEQYAFSGAGRRFSESDGGSLADVAAALRELNAGQDRRDALIGTNVATSVRDAMQLGARRVR